MELSQHDKHACLLRLFCFRANDLRIRISFLLRRPLSPKAAAVMDGAGLLLFEYTIIISQYIASVNTTITTLRRFYPLAENILVRMSLDVVRNLKV